MAEEKMTAKKLGRKVSMKEILEGLGRYGDFVMLGLEGEIGQEKILTFRKYFENYVAQNKLKPEDFGPNLEREAPSEFVDLFRPIAQRIGYNQACIEHLYLYAPCADNIIGKVNDFTRLDPLYNPFMRWENDDNKENGGSDSHEQSRI